MNLNKTLCKYLDIEEKGYVTVGDVLLRCVFFGLIATVIISLLYSFYQGILLIITDRLFTPAESINDLAGCLGISIFVIISLGLFVVFIAYICTIKIAACEYKKDNQ